MHDRVYQRQVGERLRVVSEVAPGARLELLRVQTERRGVAPAAARTGRIARSALADLRQRRHQPERADQERALLARSGRRRSPRPGSAGRSRCSVSSSTRSRAPSPSPARRRAAGSAPAGSTASRRRARRSRSAGGTRRGRTRRARGCPRGSARRPRCHWRAELVPPRALGQPRAAVQRHPAHQLRGHVVLGLAARLPDPLIGLLPDRERAARPGPRSPATAAAGCGRAVFVCR